MVVKDGKPLSNGALLLASQGFLRTTLHTQAPSRRRLYRLVGSIPGCGRQTMCCATPGVHVSSTQPQKVDEKTKRKRFCMCLPVWEKVEDVHSIFWFGWALAKKQFVDAGGMAENARDVLECRVRFVLVLVAALTCRV